MFKMLEIDIDGIFKTLLLLKKKKYAALIVEEKDGVVSFKQEAKGLDLVRRDWAELSRDVGKYVLDQILSGNSREDITDAISSHLRELAVRARGNEIQVRLFPPL